MKDADTTFKYIGIAAIALLLFGLVGWYFFISRQTANVSELSEARGFDVGVPAFTGSRGSTAENIARGFSPEVVAAQQNASSTGEERPPRMWRVNTSPVAGAGFVSVASSTLLRFIERSTGHIFDVDPYTGKIVRRTNKLIPKVYDAIVGPTDTIAARSLSDDGVRATFIGVLGTTTVDGFTPLEGVDLGPAVEDVAFTRNAEIIFLAQTGAGTQLVRSALDGSEPRQLLSLFAGDFALDLLADDKIVLTEKSASGIPSSAYTLGKDTELVPLARNVPGLTFLSHTNGNAWIIGSDTGSSLSVEIKPSSDATSIVLESSTVAEKCAWLPGASLTAFCAVPEGTPEPGYLTKWHRGVLHTTDTWYRIDVSASSTEKFFEMSTDAAIDVEHPLIDARGEFIAFMSARDKSLWILRIME